MRAKMRWKNAKRGELTAAEKRMYIGIKLRKEPRSGYLPNLNHPLRFAGAGVLPTGPTGSTMTVSSSSSSSSSFSLLTSFPASL